MLCFTVFAYIASQHFLHIKVVTQCRNGNVNYKTEIYAEDEHLAHAFKVSKSSSLLWREMVHGIDFLKFQRSCKNIHAWIVEDIYALLLKAMYEWAN